MQMSLSRNDVPHQWILDKLTAVCLMGEMDKEEVDRIHALFVQRFPDEVAQMKKELGIRRAFMEHQGYEIEWHDLEQQGDNYITESANEG